MTLGNDAQLYVQSGSTYTHVGSLHPEPCPYRDPINHWIDEKYPHAITVGFGESAARSVSGVFIVCLSQYISVTSKDKATRYDYSNPKTFDMIEEFIHTRGMGLGVSP